MKVGNCQKCNTYSTLFEYSPNWFIGKGCGCWEEEVERESGRHEVLEEKLNDYRNLVRRTQ